MHVTDLSSNSFRKSRTRTLIQLGGLIEKAGLLDDFGIDLGADLQKDEDMKNPVSALFGSLLEVKELIKQEPASIDLWVLKGHKQLGKLGS